MDPEEIDARKTLRLQEHLGHCLPNIFPLSDDKIKYASYIPLADQLLGGITLNKGALKFYLHKETNSNRLFIPAKALKIAGIDDPKQWKWLLLEEWGKILYIVEAIAVTWFDVRGSVQASFLSPKVEYLVVFVILITLDFEAWNAPINLVLKKPDGSKIESQITLKGNPIGEYFEVIVGEITLEKRECNDSGMIEARIFEQTPGQLKKGLVVKGPVFRSKASAGCPHADT